ncbi:hypothetical protein F5888DRAFT_1699443, partial [Russula emetica]
MNLNVNNSYIPVNNLFTDTNVTVSSWSLFAAAMTTDQGLSDGLISDVSYLAYYASTPFPVYFGSFNGSTLQGAASPAQGAMFAPLALKVPNKAIIVTAPNFPSHRTRNKNVGAIVGGIIGGVAAIFAVIGIVSYVQRQRRRKPKPNRPEPIVSFPTDSIQANPRITVTHPNFSEATRDSGITTEQQPISRPVTPVPVGLSDKELARLRTAPLTSQQADNSRGEASNAPQLTLSPTAVRAAETGGAALPSDTQRLHSEVELLRWEMERLRASAEGSVFAAPPSYTEGN